MRNLMEEINDTIQRLGKSNKNNEIHFFLVV